MPPKQEPRSIKPAKKGRSPVKEQSSRRRHPSGRISAACEACKKRKTKCSGHPPPCTMCQQLDTPCVIDLSLDMRRRTALQRTIEESKSFQDTLRGLVKILREGDGDDIDTLVGHLRRNSDPGDLAMLLQTRLRERSESKTTDSDGKMEEDGTSVYASDEDLLEGSRNLGQLSALSKEQTTSGHVLEDWVPLDRRRSKARAEDGDELASKYLPLIEKIKNTSAWEASRLLHELSTSPVTETSMSLNYFEQSLKRPSTAFQTGASLLQETKNIIPSMDRRFWHHSLQLSTEESPVEESSLNRGFPTPWSRTSSSLLEDLQLSPRSGEPAMVSRSNSGTRHSELTSPNEAHQFSKTTQPTDSGLAYGTAPSHKSRRIPQTSEVIEIFGDVRALMNNGPGSHNQAYQTYNMQSAATVPAYLIQPRLALEDSPLSKVYTGFRDAARHMIASGTPAAMVIEGLNTVVDLFFRERRPSDAFTCSSWASELCRTFVEIDVFVRLGCVFLLTRLMRWLLVPTPETYANLPQLMRPTPTQCFVPHIPAIDLTPIPIMRDTLCYRAFDWMTPAASFNLSVNWPYTMDEALQKDDSSGAITISQLFSQHVSMYDSWSVNSYALTIFPELVGKIRVSEERDPMTGISTVGMGL